MPELEDGDEYCVVGESEIPFVLRRWAAHGIGWTIDLDFGGLLYEHPRFR